MKFLLFIFVDRGKGLINISLEFLNIVSRVVVVAVDAAVLAGTNVDSRLRVFYFVAVLLTTTLT